MGMFDPKKRKIFAAVIAVILVLAMVVPSVLSILYKRYKMKRRMNI